MTTEKPLSEKVRNLRLTEGRVLMYKQEDVAEAVDRLKAVGYGEKVFLMSLDKINEIFGDLK